jgi:3-deoxy-D-manno-octulosonic-acid transferase
MRHAYSVLLVLLLPVIVVRMLLRSRRAPQYRRRLRERLGFIRLADDPRPLLWIHAVSLGETLAARPLIERLLSEGGERRILVTTTTPTGSEQVRRLFGDRVEHVYAPWDTPGAVRRFFERTRPQLLVLMETELWPNMLHFARRTGCRVILANARLSERSAAGYARFPGTTHTMLDALDYIAAQSAADAERFIGLGMNPGRVEVSGSIKFDVQLDETLRSQAAELRSRWQLSDRPVFLVASTHRGEDEVALDALSILQVQRPDTLMLLAPRHPERFNEVAALCSSAGVNVCRRSSGAAPDAGTQVLLIDTLGELLMLFGLANVAVIGGSFVPRGGHNPLEAAVWGMPVLCGPSMFNFSDVTERLLAAGALEQVKDSSALAGALAGLLSDPMETKRRGSVALEVMRQSRGALDALVAAILRIEEATDR